VSENIFALTEKVAVAKDLLSGSTPENHPEALLLVNKEYAKNLLMNEEFFEFLKQSHDIENMHGVTLHLAFANADLINELMKVAHQKTIDGIKVKSANHQALLVAQIAQEKKYYDDRVILKKALSIYI
jgi:LAS superfamily LD-carboxypeptidase LdcB